MLFVLNRTLNQSLAADRPVEKITVEDGRKFDYFVLNMIWPTTLCGKVKTGSIKMSGVQEKEDGYYCSSPKHLNSFQYYMGSKAYRFTIHGLWPSDTGMGGVGRGPQFCAKKREFKKETRGGGVEDSPDFGRKSHDVHSIGEYWPSFITANADFWKKQWEKHGRCAAYAPVIGYSGGYFHKTVRLAAELVDLQENLRALYPVLKSGKTVSIQRSLDVNFQNLRTFLNREFGGGVGINWHPIETRNYGREYWIEALLFCYDVNLNRINCDLRENNFPRVNITFPLSPALNDWP